MTAPSPDDARATPRLGFRGIRSRLMVATTVLLLIVSAGLMLVWTASARDELRSQRTVVARALARGMQSDLESQLAEGNWGRMRLSLELVLLHNPEVVYAIVSDNRRGDEIVGAVPVALLAGFVPDMVPLAVTRAALATPTGLRTTETVLLRDLAYPEGTLRARAGEPILETAIALERSDPVERVGTLRLGISLRELEAATWRAVVRVLLVGVAAILVGLLGAFLVARRIARPIVELTHGARVIAAGDLGHRVHVTRHDEIGSLARDFNSMAQSLEHSFERLQATLASFERFVPRRFLHVIAPQGIERIGVGNAAVKTMSILFSDIRGYTTLSEGMTPMEIFEFLNEYLTFVGKVIDAHGGFIDKYIGDAIMALFEDEASDGAVEGALAMRAALGAFNESRVHRGFAPIDTGIGIHRGEVVMGAVGFWDRIDPTVIGDAVNVASRVEGVTKQYHTPILVTREVVEALRHPERFAIRQVATGVMLKGKGESVELYAIAAAETAAEAPPPPA